MGMSIEKIKYMEGKKRIRKKKEESNEENTISMYRLIDEGGFDGLS